MRLEKQTDTSTAVLPLMAALSYNVVGEESDVSVGIAEYDPKTQVTTHAARGDSRSRDDDSVWTIFSTKSDTKTDD